MRIGPRADAPVERARHRAERALLGRFAPPWMLVDDRLHIIDLGGRTAPYLARSDRGARSRLPELVRPALLPAIRSALREARREMRQVGRDVAPARRGAARVNIEVVPIAGDGAASTPCYLVLFGGSGPAPDRAVPARPAASQKGDDRLARDAVDSDAHRRALADAHAALDRAAAMLDAVRVPLLVLDERSCVRSANRAFFAAFAGQPDILGASWFAIDGGAWAVPALRAALDDLVAAGQELTLDVEVEIPRGRKRTVAVAGSALRAEGEPPLLLLTLVDVTERAALLRAADEARAVAQDANRTKDVFLATLSHELRVPLHTITLQADLLLTGAAPGPAKARRVATSISLAARAQEQIISDLLDVSAILAGKMLLKRQPIDMPAVVGAAVNGIRAAAAARQIRLRISLDRAAGLVVGDPNRLRQVVANLLGNAVKFTPPGGQVEVALRRSEGGVQIRVSDNGRGIEPEVIPHVFDRFVQGDSLGSATYGGLGLGLAIVRDLVRLHRGTVRAESDGPDQGATFTVDLPAMGARHRPGARDGEADRPDQEPVAAARRRDELRGIRVLIVEDDPSSRDVLTDILRFRAAEVLAVASAAEVMDALADFRPDVMLCDVAMPGEDGYSLMRRVRALEPDKGGRIPAVALTALATKEDRRRALTAGFHLHVAKPTPAAELCDAVRKVYNLAHPSPHRN